MLRKDDEKCEGPKLHIPEELRKEAFDAYRNAEMGKGLAGGTSCPNCGYCPSCGRSNNTFPSYPNQPFPGQVWCSTTGPKC